MVEAVASDDPQIAPNPAQAPTVAIANPPRRPANNALAAANSSCAIEVRAATTPMSRNSGTTDSE